jgi:serine/threonine protein kinase
MLSSGTRIDVYEVIAPIGAGGMGEVYRAHDSRLGREVAIKVLPAASANDPDRLKRFEQEARAAASLNHPNILAIHDTGTAQFGDTAGPSPYIVSELLHGQTLRSLLQRGEPLAVRKALNYAVQLANGLAAAHASGIVHRDLKPDNIFITNDEVVKILDFGLARVSQPVSSSSVLQTMAVDTQPGTMMGTLGYMAPEQLRGLVVEWRADPVGKPGGSWRRRRC